MISADFAPNEQLSDAWLSLKLLLQPWLWKKGMETDAVKKKVLEKFFHVSRSTFYVSLFLSARAGLFTILKGLNLPKDSEIIVQAFTCESVILPILENGFKPVYVDIEPNTLSMDPIDFQKKITGKTTVVILQHTFGIPPIYRTKLYEISKKHNLVLIEDIAHGYSIENNKKLDIKDEKYIFLLSFGRSKALSSVFGGGVVTNDVRVQKALEKSQIALEPPTFTFILRLLLYKPISVFIKSTYDLYIGKLVHAITNLFKLLIPEITQREKEGLYDPLFDKAYPNALAMLLLPQLDKYEQMYKARALTCSLYHKHLSNYSFLNFQPHEGLLRFPIQVNNPESLRKKAARHNIYLGSWYNQVVAPKSIDLSKMQYHKGSCPQAEKVCKKILNLTTNISYHEALKVISVIK